MNSPGPNEPAPAARMNVVSPRDVTASRALHARSSARTGGTFALLSKDTLAKACIVGLLFFSSIGLSPPAIFGGDETAASEGGGGVLIKQVAYLGLLAVSLTMVLGRRHERLSPLLPIALGMMLAWIWASLGWSEVPGIAIRRIVITTIVICSTFMLASTLEREELFNFLALTFLVMLIGDLVAVAALPGAVSQTSDTDQWSSTTGTWRGLHLEKNAAGAFGALAALLFLYRAAEVGRGFLGRIGWAAAALVAIFYVYKTGSKTSAALVPMVCLLAIGTAAIAPHRRARLLVALAMVIACCSIVLLMPDLFLDIERWINAILQDPRSFTGRSQIWLVELRFAREHPWLGSGYGSFWSVGETGPLFRYAQGWLKTVPAGHNGYFDMVVQTGLVGLALAVIGAIVVPGLALVTRRDLSFRNRWILGALLLFFTFHNLLETSLFDRDNIVWVLALFAIASLAHYPRNEPRRSAIHRAGRQPFYRMPAGSGA